MFADQSLKFSVLPRDIIEYHLRPLMTANTILYMSNQKPNISSWTYQHIPSSCVDYTSTMGMREEICNTQVVEASFTLTSNRKIKDRRLAGGGSANSLVPVMQRGQMQTVLIVDCNKFKGYYDGEGYKKLSVDCAYNMFPCLAVNDTVYMINAGRHINKIPLAAVLADPPTVVPQTLDVQLQHIMDYAHWVDVTAEEVCCKTTSRDYQQKYIERLTVDGLRVTAFTGLPIFDSNCFAQDQGLWYTTVVGDYMVYGRHARNTHTYHHQTFLDFRSNTNILVTPIGQVHEHFKASELVMVHQVPHLFYCNHLYKYDFAADQWLCGVRMEAEEECVAGYELGMVGY